MKSFHSSHTFGASGHDVVVGSSRRLIHSYSPSHQAIREESKETLTQPKTTNEEPPSTASEDDIEDEYLVRRQTLGEFDFKDIDAIRKKYGGTGEVTDDVSAGETTEPKLDEVVDAVASGMRRSRMQVGMEGEGAKLNETQKKSIIETLQTYSHMDATERRLQEQHQLEEKEHEQEVTRARVKERGAADTTTVATIPDVGRVIPLSESAICASDAVTVDILDRAIKGDLRRLPKKSPDSLCVLAAMIVSRVLQSACSRVTREDRLPPAKTLTEKARREAVLLVEDVLSSAVIYVSRGGDTSSTKPTDFCALTSTKATCKIIPDVTDDALWQPSTSSTSEQTSQQTSQLSWKEQDDQENDQQNAEKDRVAPDAPPSYRYSLTERLFIIKPPEATSAEQERAQQDEHTLKPELQPVSRAQLSVIDEMPRALERRSQQQTATRSETLSPIASQSILQKPEKDRRASEEASTEQSSMTETSPDEEDQQALKSEATSLRPLSSAQLSSIEHRHIARELWSYHSTTPPDDMRQPVLQRSVQRVAVPNSDSTHDHRADLHQIVASYSRRRSSIVSAAPTMPNVDEDDDDHASVQK